MTPDSVYLTTHRLKKEVYLADPFFLAQQVLPGAYLCSCNQGILTAGRITELEVYLGGEDKASHTYQYKKTPRTAVQWEAGGLAYIFFVYGMHHQFCVTTSPENQPNAILIRALEPIIGWDEMKRRRRTDRPNNLTTGPGKLCQALAITTAQNGTDLTGDEIWIAPRTQNIPQSCLVAAPRVGVDYAAEYAAKKWRFYLKESRFISKK